MPSVLSFNTPNSPLTPVLSAGSYNAPFNVTATFLPDSPGGSCAALVYRQYVSGTFTVDSLVVPFYLCAARGVMLSATTPQEDGCPPNGSNCTGATAYGYRECVMVADAYTNPNQTTGADYWMFDAPGFTNVQPGHTYGIDLNFRGEIQNTGATVTQATWRVSGSQAIPPTAAPMLTASPTCDHGETPVMLRVDDTVDGRRMAILSLVRQAGAPPLSPAAIGVRLWDKAGHEIHLGAGTAHEVGNSRQVTAHIIYSLPAGAAPVRATVAMNGAHWGELTVTFD